MLKVEPTGYCGWHFQLSKGNMPFVTFLHHAAWCWRANYAL